MFSLIFGGELLLRIAGKMVKIVKIKTRKNFVPHGIASSVHDLNFFLFFWQLVSIFEENNEKNRPVRRRKASAHLKFSLIAGNTIEL